MFSYNLTVKYEQYIIRAYFHSSSGAYKPSRSRCIEYRDRCIKPRHVSLITGCIYLQRDVKRLYSLPYIQNYLLFIWLK